MPLSPSPSLSPSPRPLGMISLRPPDQLCLVGPLHVCVGAGGERVPICGAAASLGMGPWGPGLCLSAVEQRRPGLDREPRGEEACGRGKLRHRGKKEVALKGEGSGLCQELGAACEFHFFCRRRTERGCDRPQGSGQDAVPSAVPSCPL